MIKMMMAAVCAVAVAGCATTAVDLTARKPALVLHTTKSVAAYSGCVAPQLQRRWPFVQSTPIEDGQQLTASGSMSIPKVMVAIDVTARVGGATVTYFPKDASAQHADADVIRGCI